MRKILSGKNQIIFLNIHQIGLMSIFVLLLILGCGKTQSDKINGNLQMRAYRLIDDNQIDDAISLLSHEIDKRDEAAPGGFDDSPETSKLRVTMASAYAKKAGVQIFEIAKSLKILLEISSYKIYKPHQSLTGAKPSKEKPATSPDHGDSNESGHVFQSPVHSGPIENKILKGIQFKNASRDYFDFLESFLEYFKFLQMTLVLPKVTQENYIYLYQSIKILNSAPNLSPGDFVYSAFLKAIQFRTIIESEEFKKNLPYLVKEENQCIAMFGKFGENSSRAIKMLLSGLNDLEKAMPEKKEELRKSSEELTQVMSRLDVMNSEGIIINNFQSSSFLFMFKSLGFGSLENNCGLDEFTE